jgi:hypothetical protein
MTTGRINQVTAFFLIPKDFSPCSPFCLSLEEGQEGKGREKNALQRLPSGRGFFYPVKEEKKKPFQG